MSPVERRAAYACDITYCTNKDLAFDYLRDRVALGRTRAVPRMWRLEKLRGGAGTDRRVVLRGLHFGIVDEADSVFIDEARTPLILSASKSDEREGEMLQRGPRTRAARSSRGAIIASTCASASSI